MRVYLFVLLIAAAVTYLFTPVARWVARRTHAMTPLRDRDVHTVPTPRLGGLAMFVGLAVAFVFASNAPFFDPVFSESSTVWAILAGAAVVCFLGVADDIWDLDAITKLVGQILGAGIMAWGGVQIVSLPVGGLIVMSRQRSIILTVLIVVIAINAVNFVDGLDGLAAGIVAIGGAAFFLYSYLLAIDSHSNYANAASLVIVALVGCCLGFLPHNFFPARIFMGDSGAMLIGLVLAASTVVVTGQIDPAIVASKRLLIPAYLPILLPVAVMIVPLVDLFLAVIRRVSQGRSPFSADSGHLHHRLLSMGHSHRRAVVILYIWTAVFAFGVVILVRVPLDQAKWVWAISILIALILTLGPLRGRRKSKILDGVEDQSSRAAIATETTALETAIESAEHQPLVGDVDKEQQS